MPPLESGGNAPNIIMSSETTKLDLAAARARLETAKGRDYWRSLEELAGSEGFEEMLQREFPRQASEWDGGDEGRRNFLKLMGASLALGGLGACTKQPTELIYPYVNAPENQIPGKPLFLCHGFHPKRRFHGRSHGKPRGPAHEGRR